jgi:hypothetical protein
VTRQAQALRAAVAALEDDADPEDVEASLIRRGLDREAAAGILAEAHAQVTAARARVEARRRPLAAAFLAGVPAALAGGALWGWIVASAGYRVGPLAWGIGLLAGAAVLAAGKRRGHRAQLVAVGCAFVGLLLGKELAFALSLHDLTSGRVGVLSLEAQKEFFTNLGSALGPGDVLPVVLALWGAWAMPRRPRQRRRVLV